jgi:hypothetical protein
MWDVCWLGGNFGMIVTQGCLFIGVIICAWEWGGGMEFDVELIYIIIWEFMIVIFGIFGIYNLRWDLKGYKKI